MPITRHGPTPTFLRYVSQQVLIPFAAPPPPNIRDYMEAEAYWLQVPIYQRGIAWSPDDLEELLESRSALLGSAVLGKFPRLPEQFQQLPADVRFYATLVDGLQRFSVGTALLALLYPRVLTNECQNPEASEHFSRLRTQASRGEVVFLHNDAQLRGHPRKAISDGYANFRARLDAFISEQFATRGQLVDFAEDITRLFLDRQVAVDVYSDFSSPVELTFTFIGMNTVRVDLSPVDLVRAAIVERAISSGWRASQIETFENRFTETFMDQGRPRSHLLPFVGVLRVALETRRQHRLFTTWEAGLQDGEVERFLDYVSAFEAQVEHPYLREIKDCGSIPYAGILTFYYANFRDADRRPSFLTNGSAEDGELRAFLRANYRVLLDGRIGRTRKQAEEALVEPYPTLDAYANALSSAFLGRGIDAAVDQNWLRDRLRQVDKKRAKRIFNCMRLGVGGDVGFLPDVYGATSNQLHIDHLIPQKVAEPDLPGYASIETIVNFAPLPAKYNVAAKDTPCAEKLASTGMYARAIQTLDTPHPYCEWLVTNQGGLGARLDEQSRLEANLAPDIPGQRLSWMVERLLPRL